MAQPMVPSKLPRFRVGETCFSLNFGAKNPTFIEDYLGVVTIEREDNDPIKDHQYSCLTLMTSREGVEYIARRKQTENWLSARPLGAKIVNRLTGKVSTVEEVEGFDFAVDQETGEKIALDLESIASAVMDDKLAYQLEHPPAGQQTDIPAAAVAAKPRTRKDATAVL